MPSNQYILKQTSEKVWHFFHHEKNGICFKTKHNNEWDNYEILLKDGIEDFNVIIPDKDNIHLVCQDQNGSIIYLKYKDEQWHKYVVLQNKMNKVYPKHFKILFINGWINLIYTIHYKEQNLLVHHVLDNSDVPPNVIDSIYMTPQPFSIATDASNNIYIYYHANDQSDKIGYRIYLWAKKMWSDFITFDVHNQSITTPYALIDSHDNTHLVYLKKIDTNYQIIHKRKPYHPSDKATWEEENIIYTRGIENSSPVLFKTGKKLWLLWQQHTSVFSCFSQDDGLTWSNPSQFMAGRYGDIELYGYRTALFSEKENIICDKCYGYRNNIDIVLYVLSNYLDGQPQTKSPYESPYKAEGYDIEEFAKRNMDAFVSPTSSTATNHSKPPITEDSSTTSDDIQITKLKISFNMLQEELIQVKKKLLNMEQQYNQLVNDKIEQIDKKISSPKRADTQSSFEDLLNNAKDEKEKEL